MVNVSNGGGADMPINAGLINALSRPVRSVQDYQDDYARQDDRASLRQRNALMMEREQQQIQHQRTADADALQQRNALLAERKMLPQPGADPRQQSMYRLAQAGVVPPTDYINELTPKPIAPSRHVVGGSLVDVGRDGVPKTLYEAPEKKPIPPEIVRVIDHIRTLPPGDPNRRQLEQYVQKQLTHAPGTTVNTFGSPVPFNLPDGSIGYAQPGNRAGMAPQVMAGTDGKPLTKPAGADGAPTEGERKAATLLQRMRFSANQIVELTGGAAGAGMDTPDKWAAALSVLPVVGDVAARSANPQSRRIIEDAQLDVLDAALTLGTGAAYTREQLEGYRKSYFPQIGDTPVDAKSKRERLANVLKAGETQAGRAAKGVPEFAPAGAAGAPAVPDAVAAALARHGGKK
jgi:hypothetical protein